MSAQHRFPEMPETIGGRYRVLSEIGKGGMGRVFRVEHLHTGEHLAMKVLYGYGQDPVRSIQRFKREARSLAQVRHENVVRVIDADISEGLGDVPYIVMELLSGEDLGTVLRHSGKLAPSVAVAVLGEVALGLKRVHRAGLLHRDLKPANVFLHSEDDRVMAKLLDFGLAKPAAIWKDGDFEGALDSQVVGTPEFMSPEQLLGQELGPATDIWAFGIMAFFMLSGRPYWNVKQLAEGIRQITNGPDKLPSTLNPMLPVAFDNWFFTSCAKRSADRWPDPITQWEKLTLALAVSLPAEPFVFAERSGWLPRTESDSRTETIDAPSANHSNGNVTPAKAVPVSRGRRQITVMFYRLTHNGPACTTIPAKEFETIETQLGTAALDTLGELHETESGPEAGVRYALFGYPVAYGSDARRAVEAALGLTKKVREQNSSVNSGDAGTLEIRVGIHTSVVALAPLADTFTSLTLARPAMNIAAELEKVADDGQIIVSEETWNLLGNRFQGERIDSARFVIRGMLEHLGVADSLPMVGRSVELALLKSRLEEARAGESQTALIWGEVGFGKTRLLRALRDSPEAIGVEWLECRCSPYFRRTPFHPMQDVLRALLSNPKPFSSTPPSLAAEDVEALIKALALEGQSKEALNRLSLPPQPDKPAIDRLSPLLQRERAINALLSLFYQRAAVQPLVLAVEDLHWADPSTLELLDRMIVMRNTPLLLALTARPDFKPNWISAGAIMPIQLRRLPTAQAKQLIGGLSTVALADHEAETLARTADGVPMFIEELVRLVSLKSGLPPGQILRATSMPTTLREALHSRLDRLGSARPLAEIASVIGPEFEIEDLRVLAGEPRAFETQVKELLSANVFQPCGPHEFSSLRFQHSLLQDTAYGSLSPAEQQRLHLQAAQILASRQKHPPEILAHHFAAGGLATEAAALYLRAGQLAFERSANAEARSHFQRGIDVLANLPAAAPEEKRKQITLDITLRTLIGMSWVVSKGYAVPEAGAAFREASELVRTLHENESPELVPALWCQWMFLLVSGHMMDSVGEGERLLRLAERHQDPGISMLAHLAVGTSLHGVGEFTAAVNHFDETIRLYHPDSHASYRFLCGQDPLMFAKVFKAWSLWCLGFPDRAAQSAQEGLAWSEGLRHPNSLGMALAISAMIHQYRGESNAVRRLSQRLADLSIEQGWLHWLGHARLWRGAADVLDGRIEPGLAEIQAARHLAAQTGEKSGAIHYDAILIDGFCQSSQFDEALAQISRTKQTLAEGGERAFESEIFRLEGEIARQRGQTEMAQSLFSRAMQSAASRNSLSYELRAALSLARSERDSAPGGDGLKHLQRVYNQFKEGFESGDLLAARSEIEMHRQSPIGNKVAPKASGSL